MDLLLAPDQMVLQIHESIGHPLELDRILGDERNYAGTSFVTADMFGSFQYGSELLNVTFDPTVPGQLASYGFDDDGTPATRQHLIENGILVRGLGGAVSQQRTGLAGRRQLPRVRMEPAADRPDGQPERRARRLDRRGTDRLDRERRLHAHQHVVVDRRQPQQVPVRLRVRAADRERRDRRRRPQPRLPRDLARRSGATCAASPTPTASR